MADKSLIEWTDATWNPIRARNLRTGKVGWHCEHATTGCEFCYAEGFNKRLGTGLPFKPGHLARPSSGSEASASANGAKKKAAIELFLDGEMLTQPLRWKKQRMIFPNSMTDLFAEFVPDEWIDRIFAVMALTPQHTYQVLTKRAKRMRDYCLNARVRSPGFVEHACGLAARIPGIDTSSGRYLKIVSTVGSSYPLPNVWLGVSAERQEEFDERVEQLGATPAAVRFVSVEPMLGPIDCGNALDRAVPGGSPYQPIDWIICGGESGSQARPMHPDWARSLRDQCKAAGVAFFFKQWGEWAPGECSNKPSTRTERVATWSDDTWDFDTLTPRVSQEMHVDDEPDVYRFGKEAAGRMLDGELHSEMPEVAR